MSIFHTMFYVTIAGDCPTKRFLDALAPKMRGRINMIKFDDYRDEQLKDPEFRKEYDAMQPEMDVIRALIDARNEQNLTQKELAERTGIHQSDISKIEQGVRNPSLRLLQKLADGMGMVLRIQFIPKNEINPLKH